MRWPLPFRWRLTAWNAGFLAVCLILFGVGLYLGLRYFLYSNLDEQVIGQGRIVVAALDSQSDIPTIADATLRDYQNPDSFVRILRPDGTVLQDPGESLRHLAVTPELIAQAANGDRPLAQGIVNGRSMVYVTLPIHDDRGTLVGILQTGASRDDIDELLNLLVIGLVLATPAIVAIALVGGYLLAGRTLQPVAGITAVAASIGASDLHARLNLDLPDDELGRLARTFDGMLARIEDAFTRQRQFTSDAAHELRTPLSLMRGEIDLALARQRSAEEYHDLLREFDVDLTRLTRLVETLLNLTRADQQGLVLDRSVVALDDIVLAICDQYEDAARQRGIGIVVEVTPVVATLDQDLVIQVLVNLVDNALFHTPSPGTVAIGCHRAGDAIELWVRDSGVGIPPEHLPRIFDRFYRVESSRTRSSGGAGLGLAIVMAIVDAHGGAIEVTSAPNAGTTFLLRFPCMV